MLHMKKSKPSRRSSVRVPAALPMMPESTMPPMIPSRRVPKRWLIVFVLVLLLGGLLATNRGLLFAAIVNGKPIFAWELNRELKTRFGAQTLEGIIGERLVAEEASKQGVTVTDGEIEAKRQEVVTSVGGDAQFEDLLKFQGMTKADFEHQIRLQLLVQKLLGKDVEVTESEIDVYIRDNGTTLSATDAAQMRVEARNILLDQKIGEKIQPWFAELKDKSNIMRFL